MKKGEVRAYTYMYRLNVQAISLASFLFLVIVLLTSNFIQGENYLLCFKPSKAIVRLEGKENANI